MGAFSESHFLRVLFAHIVYFVYFFPIKLGDCDLFSNQRNSLLRVWHGLESSLRQLQAKHPTGSTSVAHPAVG
jgi:hypothetical protein